MEIKYKGISILFDGTTGEWKAECDYGKYQNVDINKVREWIDKKSKKEFVRYDVILDSYYGEGIVTVTSENDGEVWVIDSNGRRSKELKSKTVMVDDESLGIYNKIKKIKEELNRINEIKHDEIEELREKLFK